MVGVISVYGILSYLFSYTKGLAFIDSNSAGGIGYVNQLLSTGSDDNLAIEIGIVFAAILFIANIFRVKKQLSRPDSIIVLVVLSIQILYLFSIDAGSLATTIFNDVNIILLLWLTSIATMIVLALICIRIK